MIADPRPAARRRPPALRRDLRLVMAEVTGWALMVGFGEQQLGPLALALGVRESLSGVVTTVPFLLGALLQLGVPRLVRASGSWRPWTVRVVALQAASLAVLALAAARGRLPLPVLVGLLALYWASGLGAGPLWMSWMDTLVPPLVRARYFARRSVLARVSMGLAMLAAGGILERATAGGRRLLGFAVVLGLAAAARAASAAMLARQSDVPCEPGEVRDVPVTVLLGRRSPRRDGRLVLFMPLFLGGGAVALPLLPALLLEQRHLSYLTWSGLAATPFLVRMVAVPYFGRLAARRGPGVVLAAGAALAGVVPFLWVLPGGPAWYLLVAVVGGVAESAHALGGFLMLFEAIRREERCSIMATYNLAVGLALTGGAALGGALLGWLGEGARAYQVVFALSGLLQLAALAVLRGVLTRVPAADGAEQPVPTK